MKKNSEDRFFHQPSKVDLEEGILCDTADCSGVYIPKKRDITMQRKGGHSVIIRDSEYWECEKCGSFTTATEEMKRIKEEIHKQEQHISRLTLRLDPMLHQKLAKEAKSNHRSLNSELIYRLQRSFEF